MTNLTSSQNQRSGTTAMAQSRRNLSWEFSDRLHTESLILNLILSFFSDRLATRPHVQIMEDGYLAVNIQKIILNMLEKNYSESDIKMGK